MKTEKIQIRVTKEERQKLESAAKKSNMTVSQYLRNSIGPVREAPMQNDEVRELVRQLSRIGNNLNQLVVLERTKGKQTANIEKTVIEINNLKNTILSKYESG